MWAICTSKTTRKHTVYRRFGFTSETGRPLGARVKEHRKEVDSITGIFTTAEKTRTASICNKSAITDHVCNENHVIDWENAKVIDWESDKADRHIREAIWIRKTENMNQRRGELPTEPRMGQAFTYWRPALEVSPDEGFRREAETSINSMLY